jgi:polyhydroxybutyrate depolymerase
VTGPGRRAGVLALGLLLPLQACAGTESDDIAASTALPAGTSTQRLTVDGTERTYLLHIPEDVEERPALVLMLHGSGEDATAAERTYGWTSLADDEGFVVAHPAAVDRSWNAELDRTEVDDIAFLSGVVDDLVDRLDVDPARVFVAGMSRGAMMAYSLACETDVPAAIAPVAGTMVTECADPAPVSVLHIHGGADRTVPIPGGGTGAPVTQVLDQWRRVDGCAEPTVTVAATVERSRSACAAGRAVEFWMISGSGHRWPVSDDVTAESDQVDATTAAWRFFSDHPRA